MIVELDYAKKHCKIEDNIEDDLIEEWCESAEEVVLSAIGCQLDDVYDEHGYIPHALKSAICLIVGSLYRDREATAQQVYNTNPALATLVKPFVRRVTNRRRNKA